MLLNVVLKNLKEESNQSQSKNNFGKFGDVISVRKRILENPQYNWTIKELAASCNMSSSYFQIVYKKLFDSSCIADVIAARLDMARELMPDSSLSIHEISYLCGYNSLEHFSRQFKKYYGITPFKYRNSSEEI